jgi:hypothetical protein
MARTRKAFEPSPAANVVLQVLPSVLYCKVALDSKELATTVPFTFPFFCEMDCGMRHLVLAPPPWPASSGLCTSSPGRRVES